MKSYHDIDTDIELLIDELKIRQKMNDTDVGILIGITAKSLRNRRYDGTLAGLPFCKVTELARAAGYDVKFERRE